MNAYVEVESAVAYLLQKFCVPFFDLNRLFDLIKILHISLELVISYNMNFVKLTLLWQDRYYNGFNVLKLWILAN